VQTSVIRNRVMAKYLRAVKKNVAETKAKAAAYNRNRRCPFGNHVGLFNNPVENSS